MSRIPYAVEQAIGDAIDAAVTDEYRRCIALIVNTINLLSAEEYDRFESDLSAPERLLMLVEMLKRHPPHPPRRS